MGFGFNSAGPLEASWDSGKFLGRSLFVFNHEVSILEDMAVVSRIRMSVPVDEYFIFVQDRFDTLSEELVGEGE